MIIGGGIITKKDIPKLREAGVIQIFGPGTSLNEIVQFIETNLRKSDDKKD